MSRSALERAAPWAVGAIVLGVGALLASTLHGITYGQGADEGHYLGYVTQVRKLGIEGFRVAFLDFAQQPERRFFPNPLRVGWIGLAALWTVLRGVSFTALSELSLTAHLLSIALAYGFARRLFGDPRALLCAALLAFSPLWLGLARRALIDSVATLTLLASVWIFWEAVRRPESPRLRLAFMLSFATAMLVKETAVLLAVPLAAFLALERYVRGRDLPWLPFVAAFGAPLCVCAFVWLLAAGSPATLLYVVREILVSPADNLYASQVGGGPWYRYVIDYLLLSPWPTLLGIGACVTVAVRARRQGLDPDTAYLVLLTGGVLFAFSFFTMNVRYVALLELPIRLLAVGVLWELLRGERPAGTWACAAAVALLCWADYQSFRLLFVDRALYDPASLFLLAVRGMVPVQ
jgi:4-amino-4-deoxy-L-arabinose transferase-like glycosyltransferase